MVVVPPPNAQAQPLSSGGFFTTAWYQFFQTLWEKAGRDTGPSVGADFPFGFINLYGGNSAPAGWLLCDGSAVSRVTFSDLFAVIGTAYGVGDGVTSFNVPNFLGRTVIGTGAGSGLTSRAAGDSGGEEAHALIEGENGAHTHLLTDPGHIHAVNDSGHLHTSTVGDFVNDGAGTEYDNTNGDKGQTTANTQTGLTGISLVNTVTGVTIAASGSGDPHENMQPFGVATYIIKSNTP